MKDSKKYRIVIAWVIFIVFITSVLTNFLPYISYKIHYEYISKVLCINKEKPDLKCNGKCHLQKELKKTAEEETQKNALSVKMVEVESLPAEGIIFQLSNNYLLIQENKYPQKNPFFDSYICDHTTPPPKV